MLHQQQHQQQQQQQQQTHHQPIMQQQHQPSIPTFNPSFLPPPPPHHPQSAVGGSSFNAKAAAVYQPNSHALISLRPSGALPNQSTVVNSTGATSVVEGGGSCGGCGCGGGGGFCGNGLLAIPPTARRGIGETANDTLAVPASLKWTHTNEGRKSVRYIYEETHTQF
jgi:hypothetical protein